MFLAYNVTFLGDGTIQHMQNAATSRAMSFEDSRQHFKQKAACFAQPSKSLYIMTFNGQCA